MIFLERLPLGQQRCTAAHFADGPLHRDLVPAMLVGDSRCPQACCQVRFQASLRRCCPSHTPAHGVRNNWDSVSNMSQTCCEMCTMDGRTSEKKEHYFTQQKSEKKYRGWLGLMDESALFDATVAKSALFNATAPISATHCITIQPFNNHKHNNNNRLDRCARFPFV